MKTLFFCNLIPLKTGAFETLLVAIGAEFKKAGDELVLILAGEPIPEVAAQFKHQGIRWSIINGWEDAGGRVHSWRFVLPALKLLYRENPDVAVVSFGNELPALIVALATRMFSSRRVRWVWQQDQQIQDPGRLSSHISKIRLLAMGMDHFVVVYDGGKQSLVRRGIAPERISVFHNCIADYQPVRLKGWLRQELGIAPKEVILVTNGSLIPRKRIDFILQACALLCGKELSSCQVVQLLSERPEGSLCSATHQPNNLTTKRPLWRLLVIGDGPERERLGVLVAELGIADRVHFLGLRNDVREILPECDIYLHAALAETCTYAITESMAAGIPAIVTEAGAAREQVCDSESGYVLMKKDMDGFVRSMVCCIKDKALCCKVGIRARTRWQEKFQSEKAGNRYYTMYRQLSLEP